MRICGIVTEYNPFHNGHSYHIRKAKEVSECDVLIAVMSGNFVQRGECAILDKWIRSETAVKAGCDLVMELPYPYVVQRADIFAKHAVRLLALAGIDTLVFGSESMDMQRLKRLADTPYSTYKKQRCANMSMAKTMEALHDNVSSNDILGMAYLRALQTTNITPIAIQRTNGYHDEHITETISSATAIRKAVKNGASVQHTTCMAKDLRMPVFMEDYYPYLQTLLLTTPRKQLKQRFLVDEGMEGMLIEHAQACSNWDDFIQACTSARYPKSSIQRSLLHILTQTDKQEIDGLAPCDFLRVLAFNDTGRAWLKELNKRGVHIASSFRQIPKQYQTIMLRTSAAYAAALPLERRKDMMDSEVQHPIYVRSCGS